MNNFVEIVDDKIQNANLTAMDNIVTTKIEISVSSMNATLPV